MKFFLSKQFILIFTFSFIYSLAISQKKYTATDARILVNKSTPTQTDSEIIEILKTYNLSKSEKQNMSMTPAMTLQRFELAKYMLEEGFRAPKDISHMFDKPFSCGGVKSNMKVSENVYSYEETVNYIEYFMEKGLVVNNRSMMLLDKDMEANAKLISYLRMNLPEKELAALEQLDFQIKFREKDYDLVLLQSLLDTTRAVMKTEYLVFASNKTIELIDFCIKNGASVNGSSYDQYPIHAAAYTSNIELTKHLINKGADLCTVDKYGNSSLDFTKRGYKASKKRKASESTLNNYKEVLAFIKAETKDCPK